ncbi:N-acetyl-gamma-glutamyl-phosphate reductase [Pseudomonas sp. BN102]|nr:N-acetyl-gamma-glutamyl-phosphate reductase [Pseudomonas sp. BN102]
MKKIFIDGENGTTGLKIRSQLDNHPGVEILRIDEKYKKDPAAKRDLMAKADISILCLPDAAAREAVLIAQETATRIIDASSCHRTAENWTYGLPELCTNQRQRIANARLVANPGCFATAAILLLRPLIQHQLIDRDAQISIHAVSGYSGGGSTMIEKHKAPGRTGDMVFYGLELAHKHLPEIISYSGLKNPPIFLPSVGNFYQGMVVMIPLHQINFSSALKILQTLTSYYADEPFVTVSQIMIGSTIDTQVKAGSNTIFFHVLADHSFYKTGRLVLLAKLDNLGKGAATAAIQNMNIMLALPENQGITY